MSLLVDLNGEDGHILENIVELFIEILQNLYQGFPVQFDSGLGLNFLLGQEIIGKARSRDGSTS